MENINHLLYQAVSIIMFCLAVSLLFLNFHNYYDLLNSLDVTVKESIVYDGSVSKDISKVSKGQLVASLLDILEYNIIINGYEIKQREHDMDKIQFYPLNSEWFKKDYVYDLNGTVMGVVYSSIND